MNSPAYPQWHDSSGAPIACTEKIKVMQQNMEELRQTAQDAFEDGLLMGCDETQLRTFLRALIDALENPYT